MSGDIFGYYSWWWLGKHPGISGVKARDAAKHLTMHRTAPTTENYPDVNRAEAEKPGAEADLSPVVLPTSWTP